MNWGKGIVIGMGLFMAFIVILVVRLLQQDVDLEREDYYQREIGYQSDKEALENAAELDFPVRIEKQAGQLLIDLGQEKIEQVSVEFRRPNDSHGDLFFRMDTLRELVIPLAKFQKGVYNVGITYVYAGKKCLQQSQIYI